VFFAVFHLGPTSRAATFARDFNDHSPHWRQHGLTCDLRVTFDPQVLCSCPGLRLSHALYDVTRTCRLSLGVIVTSLLRVDASDVAMAFLRDVYINLSNQPSQ